MSVEYGRHGLVGVLTPQGNTTVEPEFRILFPPGVATINARMVSLANTMDGRLRDYFRNLGTTAEQFADAPVDVLAIACTGASYLATYASEGAIVAALEVARRVPVVTSGRAVMDALRSLAASRIALVSPYPPELTAASVRYWQDGGLEVVRVVEVQAQAGFHPIYAMPASSAKAALDTLDSEVGLDAVVMLGTGMPTLRPILEKPRVGNAMVLSCMLATAWRTALVLNGAPPDAASLHAWVDTPEWADRLRAWIR